MKKMIFSCLLLASGLATVCAQEKPFTIKGKLSNLGNNKLIIFYTDANNPKISITDSTTAKEGGFELKGSITAPVMAYLLTRVTQKDDIELKSGDLVPAGPLLLVLSGTNISITGDARDIAHAKVSNDGYNKSLNAYKALLEKTNGKITGLSKKMILAREANKIELAYRYRDSLEKVNEQKMALTKQFIRSNSNAWISSFLLSPLIPQLPLLELEQIYNGLAKQVKENPQGILVNEAIKSLKTIAVGNMAPIFVGTTDKNETVDLVKLRGKYVLLDFWGSWCGPCRESHSELLKLYTTYKDKGFELIGIAFEQEDSLQERKKSWLKAIKEDKLTYPQLLSDRERKENDLIKLYGVSIYPTKILLDQQGKIIARYNGMTNEIEAKLQSLLGK